MIAHWWFGVGNLAGFPSLRTGPVAGQAVTTAPRASQFGWPVGSSGWHCLRSTDDIGYRAVENPVSVHDFHATILHLLGMNHRDLVYVREGRNERLTDEFPARVVQEILT